MPAAKNTIYVWYDKDAEAAARFYAATFPDSSVGEISLAPGDYPSGKGIIFPSSSAKRGEAASKAGDPAQDSSRTIWRASGAPYAGSPNGLAGSTGRG